MQRTGLALVCCWGRERKKPDDDGVEEGGTEGGGGQGLVVLWKLFTAAESKRKEHKSGFALFLSI